MPQGVLPFHYEAEQSGSGMTALGGLPLSLELAQVAGVPASIRRHMLVAGSQGWDDVQVVLALVLLHLGGGEVVDDLRVLEHDAGFTAVLREVEEYGQTRRQRPGAGASSARGRCPHPRPRSAIWPPFTTPSKSWPTRARRAFRNRPQECRGCSR